MTTQLAASPFTAELDARLAAVETSLRDVLRHPGSAFLTQAAGHLINAGGKRLRPTVALLGAAFGPEPDGDAVVTAATVVELVHVATLYHDDVMDEARLRHGVPSANVSWGNRTAVLLGDYLLAKAAELGAGLGEQALRLQVLTLSRLVRGQVLETVGPRRTVVAPAECLAVLADKSASLIAMAARLGAMVAGAPAWVAGTLGEYGELLGLAFQIHDDVLDVCAPTATLGKQAGTDLREGVVTLPVLYALERDDRLRGLVTGGSLDDPQSLAEALARVRASDGPARAAAEAAGYAGRARRLAESLPAHPARDVLCRLSEFVVSRSH
ncbi:polyprenyl synthetase family protein [Amycolatopsis suaedae]|uniref:Polyprenyl synthetase family protein n=1 Tax=Amycolatopsis suaedae TaxID=2510978 RepID=A0A4V2EL85_9PSEU|nr:polyprenyl synthetase family protein [Amycolatopsis suaedae]